MTDVGDRAVMMIMMMLIIDSMDETFISLHIISIVMHDEMLHPHANEGSTSSGIPKG